MDIKQEDSGGISVQERLIDNLQCADDIDLIAYTEMMAAYIINGRQKTFIT